MSPDTPPRSREIPGKEPDSGTHWTETWLRASHATADAPPETISRNGRQGGRVTACGVLFSPRGGCSPCAIQRPRAGAYFYACAGCPRPGFGRAHRSPLFSGARGCGRGSSKIPMGNPCSRARGGMFQVWDDHQAMEMGWEQPFNNSRVLRSGLTAKTPARFWTGRTVKH